MVKRIVKTKYSFNFPDPEKIDIDDWNLRLKRIEILFNPMVQMKKRILGKRPSFLVSIFLDHDEIVKENERVVETQINQLFQSRIGMDFCKKYLIVPEGYEGKPVFNVDSRNWDQSLPLRVLFPGELPKGISQEQFVSIMIKKLLCRVLLSFYTIPIPCPRVIQETMVQQGNVVMDYGMYWLRKFVR